MASIIAFDTTPLVLDPNSAFSEYHTVKPKCTIARTWGISSHVCMSSQKAVGVLRDQGAMTKEHREKIANTNPCRSGFFTPSE